MKFPNKKAAAVIGVVLLIAAVVGAYQFRRDSKLTGTTWSAAVAGTRYEISFVSGRRVVVKNFGTADAQLSSQEGTYTSRGNHVEINLQTLNIQGDAILEPGKPEFLDLTMTAKESPLPIKLKAVKTSGN